MSKREEITPDGDKRYVRRNDKGQIKSSVQEGASLSADTWPGTTKPGQGTATAITPNSHQGLV